MSSSSSSSSSVTRVLLVFPRFFADTFWSLRGTCEALGIGSPAPPLGLITVAALLPPNWQVRLIDCNVKPLDDADIDSADLVMTGGMLPQYSGTRAVIDHCRKRGTPVVVGGPDATSCPERYRDADFLVLGEAEPVMAQFIAAWDNGVRSGEFSSEKFSADVAASPLPRFDLLNFRDYGIVNVQFSRGCPFNCEFCDIIELYGRVPRTKTNSQILAELSRLYALGYRGHVDFVDDNLIGNKKAVRQLLPELIAWQRAHGYPFEFSTEASINISDDEALLRMMREANFFTVFVGIESPDTETLIVAQKKQNARRDLVASVNKIYAAGMYVSAGFILGMDCERTTVAETFIDYIQSSSIPVCMFGLLFALPNTQLARRLQREGRLHELAIPPEGHGDQCTAGLNFETARPRRDILTDFVTVLECIHGPQAYFQRVRTLADRLQYKVHKLPLTLFVRDIIRFVRILVAIATRYPWMMGEFLYTLQYCAWRNPQALRPLVTTMAFYLHIGPFAREVVTKVRAQIGAIDHQSSIAGVATTTVEPFEMEVVPSLQS